MRLSTELSLRLMIVSGNGIGEAFSLDKPVLTIGRDPSSDICIEDLRVSSHHARIVLNEGGCTLEDLGSSNGTYVNSQNITEAQLRENDLIKVGRTLLTLTRASDISELSIDEMGKAAAEIVRGPSKELSGQTIEMAVPQAVARFEKVPPEPDLNVAALLEIQRKLFLLYKISKDISGLSNLDDLSEMILKTIFNEIGIDRGVIMLAENETGELEVGRTKVTDSLKGAKSSIQVSDTVVNHVLKTRNAVLTEDAMEDQRFAGRESIVIQGVRSVMCVPLISKDDVLGLVYVDKLSPEEIFTRDDLEFLTAICNQAAVSISNSQLYDEVRSANKRLTSLNTELVKSNEAYRETNEKLQESYRRLEEAQQRLIQSEKLSALGRLVAGIAHDLKNILTPVSAYAQLIELCGDDSRREHLVKKLNDATGICVGMVKNLLGFAREEKLEKQECDVNKLVLESAELAGKQFEGNPKLVLNMDLGESLPRLSLDKLKMIRVFTNIIANGLGAMQDDSGEGTMTISSSLEQGTVRILFADTGPGIPEENQAKVFDPFFTTKKEGKGIGLGLSLCHGIITGHGGGIYVESELGKGATFIVELPVEQ